MNPCKCGFYPDRRRCRCSDLDIERYFGRISGPMLDRFDIRIYTQPVTFEDMFSLRSDAADTDFRGEINSCADETDFTTENMRDKVCAARDIQAQRFSDSDHNFNSEMTESELKEYCSLGLEELRYFENVYEHLHLTARGCNKILKTARTIADLDESRDINKKHIAVAVTFRNEADSALRG